VTSEKELLEKVERLEFDTPEAHEISIFHEATNLYQHQLMSASTRMAEYGQSRRGMLEISRNFKSYLLSNEIDLSSELQSPEIDSLFDSRRSAARFRNEPLRLDTVSGVLSAIKVRRKKSVDAEGEFVVGARAYPSAGALYPVEAYLIPLAVEGLRPCSFYYCAARHVLQSTNVEFKATSLRSALIDADSLVDSAGAIIVFTGLAERSAVKYGWRGYRYTLLEAGMAAYAVAIAACARGVGALDYAGFFDLEISRIIGIDGVREVPLHLMFIGNPAEPAEKRPSSRPDF
jgi:SagB-type dehydrogenase family enzyme